MERKTISISPNLFSINRTKSNKKPKKELPLKLHNPTNIKRELIKKIKNYQNKTRKQPSNTFEKEFNDEFRDSISYLKNIIDEKNINNNNKLPKPVDLSHVTNKDIEDKVESNNISSHLTKTNQDVPWGILKNGNKPTYRNWIRNNTLKNKQINENINNNNNSNIINNNEINNETNNYISENKIEEINVKNIKPTPHKIKKKTIKRKYTCGKSKTKKQIGIIIKGIESRNKILKEHRDLKKETIQNIKNFLYKKSFIKIGSTAPDKVLRDMYESIVLTGNVNNKNSHILIHNYINQDKYKN
tara:strand:+ start:5124 stop:6026 length:903 start_codon:yes stop_codon:yes gene_type:complete